jgi:hypothetical protein
MCSRGRWCILHLGEGLPCSRRLRRAASRPVSSVSTPVSDRFQSQKRIVVCRTMLFMISIARPRFEAWNPVEEKCFVSCATEMFCFAYSEKSTPRICVDVAGIGAEGLSTAWAAAATSLAVAAVDVPFVCVPLGRDVCIVSDGVGSWRKVCGTKLR